MKQTAYWTVLVPLFIIPFLPVIVFNDFFFPFITSKGFVFRILVGIAAGAWVILMLADKKYRPRFSWTLLLYGLFVAWMFIADLLAINPHKALWSNYERMDGWITLIHVFLFFLVASSVLSADKLWKKWWLTVLAASTIVSIHGIIQVFGLVEIHQGGVRVDANFGNAIYLAVYFMMTVLIAVWQAVESKGWMRYTFLSLAALQVVLIFFTATRGAILGLFAAGGVIALLWSTSGKGIARKVAVGTLIALLALVGTFFLARDSAFVRSEPTLTRLASVFDAGELKVRMTLWGMAYQGFLERPLTGWGQEGYNYIFNTYYKPSLYAQEAWFDRAHNTYLDWLVAGGVPALLLFVLLLASAFLALKRSDLPRAQKIIFIGILAGYSLQAFSAFDNLMSYIMVAAILALAHEVSAKPIKQLEEAKEIEGNALSAGVAPAVLVVTVVCVWMVNVPSLQAANDLIRAAQQGQNPQAAIAVYKQAFGRNGFGNQEINEQLMNYMIAVVGVPTVPNDVKQSVATLTLTEIQKEIQRTPSDARIRLMYAQGLRAVGDEESYYKELNNALALSPLKQSLLFQKAIFLWQKGDKASAAKIFEYTYNLDTSFDTAGYYAGVARIMLGDVAGGRAFFMQKFGTTAIDDDIVRFAYYDAKMYDELISSAKAHVKARPNNAQARLVLVQAYAVTNRTAEARAELQATIAAHPEIAASVAPLAKQLGL